MTYTENVEIPAENFQMINYLLSLSDLEEMSTDELIELGAERNFSDKIFDIKFKNGCRMTYYLCSGLHNYYDEIVFYDKFGFYHDIDSEFELGDSIQVRFDDNEYIINIILKW